MSEEPENQPDSARRRRRQSPASESSAPSKSRKKPESQSRQDQGEKPARPRTGGLDARGAVRKALEELAALISHTVEGAIGVRRDDETWVVTIEVLEDAHIPSTSDILAECEVRLDDEGELLGYRRGRRYVRGRVEA
jgi:hypothetical protein